MDKCICHSGEVRKLREEVELLREAGAALERLDRNFRMLLSGKPVRDVAETEAEVRTALTNIRKITGGGDADHG